MQIIARIQKNVFLTHIKTAFNPQKIGIRKIITKINITSKKWISQWGCGKVDKVFQNIKAFLKEFWAFLETY